MVAESAFRRDGVLAHCSGLGTCGWTDAGTRLLTTIPEFSSGKLKLSSRSTALFWRSTLSTMLYNYIPSAKTEA